MKLITKLIKVELMFAFIALTMLSTNSHAQSCKYSPEKDKTTVSWIGYKLKEKAPVKGKFVKYDIKTKAGKTINDTLESASFELSGAKVYSGNAARDLKIAKFFFGNFMGGAKITGNVVKVDDDKVTVSMTMNEVTREVVMAKKLDGKKLTLSGSIDMMDFALKKSYKAISKACSVKHKGKTWTEASFELVTTFKRKC